MSVSDQLRGGLKIRSYFPKFLITESMGTGRSCMAMEQIGLAHDVSVKEIVKICDSFCVGIRDNVLVSDF
jgi:hypothetical protein